LQENIARSIEELRRQNGEFVGLTDFVERVAPGLEQLILLIRAGAFRFTGKSKAVLLWEAHMIVSNRKTDCSRSLFSPPLKSFTLPYLQQGSLEDAYDEIELLGFPVTLSWFDMLETSFRGEIMAGDMKNNTGKRVRMVGHLATVKYIKTVKKEWMNFGCFIDNENNFFDSTHFSQSLKEYPFRGSGTYLLYGKVVEEFGFQSLEVEKMARLPVRKDIRY
jgi:DNA polymerase III alpha subunit